MTLHSPHSIGLRLPRGPKTAAIPPRPAPMKKPPRKQRGEASLPRGRSYSISELAREFGITPRALRFYEDKDMLHPARDGMARVYSHRDRARLKIIMNLKRVGLALNDIREILDLYELEDGERAQFVVGLDKFRAQVALFEAQRADIDDALEQLNKGIRLMEEQLEEMDAPETAAKADADAAA